MTPNEITTMLAMHLEEELNVPFKLMLMEKVKIWRSRLIVNALRKRPADRKFYRQPYFVPMKSGYMHPIAGLVSDPLSVSIDKIPLIVEANSILFDYIGGIDGKSPFREVQSGTENYLSTGKFASMYPACKYTGSFLYVEKKDLPLAMMDTIFDDPLDIALRNCACGNTPCDPWDIEFPCSGSMMQLIIQSILQIDYQRGNKEMGQEIPVSANQEK